ALAAAAGLAPQPRFFDPDAGVLLVDYLPPDAAPEAASAEDVGGLLRAVHRLDADAPRLSLDACITHYAALLQAFCDDAARDCLASLSDPLARACRALDTDTEAAVVCHNDLTPGNRLYHRGRLYALDWEYAACGSRWFDLAVAADKRLDAVKLLEAYLQRPPSAPERAQIVRARLIARYLELLWLACNTDIEAREVLSGLRALTARVDSLAAVDHAP
ncbi:MAG: phosphotransferase, partial [Chromatocurvus sp.]